ncbi:MAG: hypothetical protein VX574_11115 [Myxococcota bacterium]|nr:hypothetical protein [Myxococcota bacterium]
MRRAIFHLLAFAFSIALAGLLVEASIRGFDLFADQRAELEIADAAGTVLKERPQPLTVPHPYRAWADRTGRLEWFSPTHHARSPRQIRSVFGDSKPSPWASMNVKTNSHGYLSSIDDYRDVATESFVVGIFGGSVAAQVAVFAGDTLSKALEEAYPDLRGRIVILNFSSGGYRQPQQLYALTEALLLGIPIDLVLNIDGLNEVAFGFRNALNGYHPFIPEKSRYATAIVGGQGSLDLGSQKLVFSIMEEKERISELEALPVNQVLIRKSETLRAAVGVAIARARVRIHELEVQLDRRASEGEIGVETATLSARCDPETTCWSLVGGLWERSSILMRVLSESAGAEYVHVLQPNQYVEGSKRLNQQETDFAFSADSLFKRTVPPGYKLLRERGARLAAQGEKFVDMTDLFAEDRETIYIDDCCHYNARGYRALARAIATEVEIKTNALD